MKKWWVLATLLAVVVATMALPSMAWAQYPCLFYGTVKVNGELVGKGIEITAWVEGKQVGSTTTDEQSVYRLTVQLREAKEVSFKIGDPYNVWADQKATWVMFGNVEVNLTATTEGGGYPCLFYGTATVSGKPVAKGTEISAWIEGKKVASTTTGSGNLASNRFMLTVELKESKEVEVSFKIGELWANEKATWVQYGSVEINLTAAIEIELCAGVNPIYYTGATTSLPEALNNIKDLTEIIWARGRWTGCKWWFYLVKWGSGDIKQLEYGKVYIIVVKQACTWKLISSP